MGQTLSAVVLQANAIAEGDYSTEIVPTSDTDELGIALANMTSQLRQTTEENQRQNWLKTGQAELNDCMRGDQSTIKLAQNIITQIHAHPVFVLRWYNMIFRARRATPF